jgi:hypothetical protein
MRRVLVAVLVLLAMGMAVAQEKSAPAQNANEFSWSAGAYRLDFALKELAAGKVVNSREYTMMLMAANRPGAGHGYGEIKAGNKVPLQAEKGPIYMDVGIDISAQLYQLQSGALFLQTTSEITSLAPDTAYPSASSPGPMLRSSKANSTGEITVGKPTLLTSVDDPVSNHRFQLEVTVNKAK